MVFMQSMYAFLSSLSLEWLLLCSLWRLLSVVWYALPGWAWQLVGYVGTPTAKRGVEGVQRPKV